MIKGVGIRRQWLLGLGQSSRDCREGTARAARSLSPSRLVSLVVVVVAVVVAAAAKPLVL